MALWLVPLVLGTAHAFSWSPLEFPAGDQGYLLELHQGENRVEVDITITETGGRYAVESVTRSSELNIHPRDLTTAVFGGSLAGSLAFGPIAMFGPSFFILPMLTMSEEIRVRATPLEVLGIGRVHMEREEQVAGRSCVVVRIELLNSEEIELWIAEGLPFPCYSRYQNSGETFEMRLLEVR